MKKLTQIQKDWVKNHVDNIIDQIFTDCHMEMDTKSGDIDPMQVVKMDQINKDLISLIISQIEQNL